MFEKILIANRGEIACRIIKTCKRLGIKTVVVYEERDTNAAWYAPMADEAYVIESYANAEDIIRTAKNARAQAIHPGYGFLSENAEFAKLCKDEGVVFIGPSPEAISLMGDKLNALEVAQRVGVPTMPRSSAIDSKTSDEEIMFIAQQVGYPAMLKPVAAGGGMGMKVVLAAEELLGAVNASMEFSAKHFGSSKIYLEKYLPEASHIEVQVFADCFGNIVHFFERDCSIQRRNQKIIEESPANKLTGEQRDFLYNCALNLAGEIGYTNAGTVEFIISPQGEIYFLEMNTRLQVEHAVTEIATGVDLVELQIRAAAGEKILFGQKDIARSGHVIEARIYPEIPRNGAFEVRVGTILLYSPPDEADGVVRLDSALFEGYTVLPYYEPLMAKLIVKGANKQIACAKICQALDAFGIVGVSTNIRTLKSLILCSEFLTDSYTTRLLLDQSLRSELEEEASAYEIKIYEEYTRTKILNDRIWKHVDKLN